MTEQSYQQAARQIDQWQEQSQNLIRAFTECKGQLEKSSSSESTELAQQLQQRQQHLEQDIEQMQQLQQELASIS